MSFSLPPLTGSVPFNPDSPYSGTLAGTVPLELAIAGGAVLRLGRLRAKEINKVLIDNNVDQFQLLGRAKDGGGLTAYDPHHRDIVTSLQPWTSSLDYSMSIQNNSGPHFGDTITVGEITLTIVESSTNIGIGPFEVGGSTGNLYPPGFTSNLRDWFDAHPQYNMTAETMDAYAGIRLTSTLPGVQGNGRTVSSTIADFYATNEQGTDLVYGELDQEAQPVGVAAFPAEPGDLLTYFPRGRFRWNRLIWPDYMTSKADRRAALKGTGIVGVGKAI